MIKEYELVECYNIDTDYTMVLVSKICNPQTKDLRFYYKVFPRRDGRTFSDKEIQNIADYGHKFYKTLEDFNYIQDNIIRKIKRYENEE